MVTLTIAFCLPFASGDSAADDSTLHKGNVNYACENNGKTLRLFGSGDMDDYDYDNKKELAPWSKYYDSVEEIIIENGITHIGEYAFAYFQNATKLVIPESVESVGHAAFFKMEKLTSVPGSDHVKQYGDIAFGLTGITEITLNCDVPSRCFSVCSSLKSVKLTDKVSSIGHQAFFACSSLKSIDIPDSVTSIGKEAFYSCYELSSIKLPDTTLDLGESVFKECDSLVSATLPNNIETLSAELFRGTGLTSISIPKSVKSIGNSAFCRCQSLKDILFLSSEAPTLGEEAFMLNFPESKVTSTIRSSGWANDNIFTSFVKGDSVSFDYKPIEICTNDMVVVAGTKIISHAVPEGMSVSVEGADWLESKGNTICGIAPTKPKDYSITLTCGHISKTAKIKVVLPSDISNDKSLKQSNDPKIMTVENVGNTFKFHAFANGTLDFGDGTVSNVSNNECIEHTFSESGLHQVKFKYYNKTQYVTALVVDKSPKTSGATESLYAYCPGIDCTVTTDCPDLSWDDKTLSLRGRLKSTGEYEIKVGETSYKLNVTVGSSKIDHNFKIITDGLDVTVKAASAGTTGISYWWKIADLSGKIVAEGITEEQKFALNKPGDYVCTCTMTDSSLQQSQYSKHFSVAQSDMTQDNNKSNEPDDEEERTNIRARILNILILVWIAVVFTAIAFIIIAWRFL